MRRLNDRPDDDGSFKRRTDFNRRDEPSRSDGDNNWRRGGASIGGGGGAFDDRRGGGGHNNRGGGGGYDRYDNNRGGGYERRGGYDDNRSGGGGFDSFDRRGGAGRSEYDNNNDRGAGGGFDSFRRGGYDRGGDNRGFSSSQPSSGGTRPKLQLKTRTAPVPEPPKEEEKKQVAVVEQEILKEEPVMETKEEVTKEEAPVEKEEEIPAPDTNEAEPVQEDGWETVEGVKVKTTKEAPKGAKKPIEGDKKDSNEGGEKKPSKKREPKVVNSRAAMLESAPEVKRDVSSLLVSPRIPLHPIRYFLNLTFCLLH